MLIEDVLRSLTETPWGWRAIVPGIEFIGQPVSLDVQTRDVPSDDPLPVLHAEDLELARLVLGGLRAALSQAEQQYRHYYRSSPEAISLAYDPHIWLCRRFRSEPFFWEFVIGISGAEDYGIHVEFSGLKCLGIWSGD
jgi:hypothetical protein